MNPNLIESIPYVSGGVAFVTTALASVSPDMTTLWIQAGVAGLFALFMLKVIPALLKHVKDTGDRHVEAMRETNDRHEATIRHIIEANERKDQANDAKDQAWQSIIQSRGVCPVVYEQKNEGQK